MKTQTAIQALVDLASRSSDKLTKTLAERLRAAGQSENKLKMLQQYRDEYRTRLDAAMLGGISPMQHANFIQFINKLDAAIVSQQQDLALRNSGADATRKELAESERKRLTFDILDRRQSIALEKKQSRLEQKITDEQAARLSALARHPGNI